MSDVRLMLGDCLDVLPKLAEKSVHCVVTSPPYFGLRDYSCDGQIGLEETPEDYVAKMVAVFRAVRRVLRDDGTLWLNLGDSFASGSSPRDEARNISVSDKARMRAEGKPVERGPKRSDPGNVRRLHTGLAPKQLLGIPWRVAFALQADGWYLRSDIIWAKPNPMPESVRDRPTKAHEYLFLLSKSATYHYDADAVREPHAMKPQRRGSIRNKVNGDRKDGGACGARVARDTLEIDGNTLGRNRRSVWTVATRPFKGAHFATFPPKLIEPCILAGTSEAGCCKACGKPWVRVVERAGEIPQTERRLNLATSQRLKSTATGGTRKSSLGAGSGGDVPAIATITLGFRPACSCVAGAAVPCTVLDPFAGAFTTGAVAKQHGRGFVGIELKPAYLEMGRERLANTPSPLPGIVGPRPTFEAYA